MARKPRNRKRYDRQSSNRRRSNRPTPPPPPKPASGGEPGFINPYNFVRWASTEVQRDQPRTHEKYAGLSGRIVIELENITPICIPDPEKTDVLKTIDGQPRFKKPFLKVDKKPYIPGSSLKGMLRSVAEAVSNSCYSVFTKELAIFRDNRNFAADYRRMGRLKKINDNKWIIQDIHPDEGDPPANPKPPVQIWKDRKELYGNHRDQLFSDNPDRTKPARSNVSEEFEQDYQSFPWYDLLRGLFGDTERRDYDENGNPYRRSNRPEQPLSRKGKPVIIRWPLADCRTDKQYKLASNILEFYQRIIESQSFQRFHNEVISLSNWQREYLAATDNEFFWYRRLDNAKNGIVSEFGRNFRYKWAYDPKQALPEGLRPCTEPHELCPSCVLFGMAEQRDEEEQQQEAQVRAFAGKMAVGPARWSGGTCDFKVVDDHKILGSPQFSCRSFYLKRSDEEDFDVSKDEFVYINENGELIPNPLRGRKFYWHHTKLWTNRRQMDYIERLPQKGDFLFSIGSEFQRELDKGGAISENLRRQFEGNELPLSQNTKILIRKNGSAWLITDRENETKYIVRKKGGQLNIYKGERPDETHQNARIEVLLPEAKFRFNIEFENLSAWELGLLLWTIELPDVEEGAHHLGLGKPIGLGTVTLKIKRIDLIDRNQRYTDLFATGMTTYENIDLSDANSQFGEYVQAFREKMAEWNGRPFEDLPNIEDLEVILSQKQPECAKIDVPIIYPPGDNLINPEKETGDAKGNVHPAELNYEWFCRTMKWSEPLVTIQQVAQKKYQRREKP